MTEFKVSEHKVLSGGWIELWAIEGRFYVKSIVSKAVKFSACMSKLGAEYLIFDTVNNGDLDF